MEQQLGALLQAQQVMQDKMLELMNHFASEKSDKSEKKMMQLDWRAMGEMQLFKGGESEWVDWKFRFSNAVGSGSLTMRKVMTFAEENTEKVQGATCDEVVQRLEVLPGTNDDLEGTYGFVKEMSGKMVKNCSDEAFGIVRSVESGDGVEAWVKLHQKYSQRTMSRMMRVLTECMYPKEVKGSELVQAILQWEMKWIQMVKDQPSGRNIPELWKMCPKEIKHNIELSWDTIREKYSVMREKVVIWATNAAEKEGGPVLWTWASWKESKAKKTRGKNVTSTSGWMRSTRRRGATSVRGTVVSAPRRAKVREGWKVEEKECRRVESKEAEKDSVTRGSAGHAGGSVTNQPSATSTWLATWSTKRVWTR